MGSVKFNEQRKAWFIHDVDANDERNQQTIGSAKIAGLQWLAKLGPPVLVQTAEPPR